MCWDRECPRAIQKLTDMVGTSSLKTVPPKMRVLWQNSREEDVPDEEVEGSFRDECLNVNWFLSIEDAQEKIEKWRLDYNEFRPPSSLGD